MFSTFTSRNALLLLAWGCLVGLCACAPEDDSPDPATSITVGLLLPYTGPSAATGANFERAALMAAESVNQAGGIDGRSLRIVARDTFSDSTRSLNSVDQLIAQGARVIIGPESPEIALAIRDHLADERVVFVSPYLGEAEAVSEEDCRAPWFRLAPSASALGDNLANELANRDIKRIAVLTGSGDDDRAFQQALVAKFTGPVIGGSVLSVIELDEENDSFARAIQRTLDTAPEAIVLSTSPQLGATVVTETALLEQRPTRWALSPRLKTPLFLQNVDARWLEGAFGVAPRLFDTRDEFPEAFAERWLGDAPLEGAYFYYDAIGLVTTALAIAAEDGLSFAAITSSMIQAASSRGLSVGWNELPRGLELIEQGREVRYSGVTGPVLLRECGERQNGRSAPWQVEQGAIVEAEP